MMAGKIEIESLEAFIKVWRDNGMPNYVEGKKESLEDEKKLTQRTKKQKYRKPFIEHTAQD